MAGLSPRVRGNHFLVQRLVEVVRSIPACAGEPAAAVRHYPPAGVYPRVCGGTAGVPGSGVVRAGLSPRVRGNRQRSAHIQPCGGSIPACAGEPRRRPGTLARPWVYPRVCGGTTRWALAGAVAKGLSPRVRGNPDAITKTISGGGSIPACAGEPGWSCRVVRQWPVYPRVCGGTHRPNDASR